MVPITDLIMRIESAYSLTELDDVSFGLGLNQPDHPSNLSGSFHNRVKRFVLNTYRTGNLERLITRLIEDRPMYEWPAADDIEVYRDQDDSLEGLMAAYFASEELEDICLSLRFDYADFPGSTKRDKVSYLISYVHQRGLLEDLLRKCSEYRPQVSWPSFEEVEVADNSQSIPNLQLANILQTYYPQVWQELIDRQLYKSTHIDLLRKIRDHFNLSEIKDICFSLDIRYEDLAGDTHLDKTRELVEFAKRTQVMSRLIAVCQDIRPTINWRYYID